MCELQFIGGLDASSGLRESRLDARDRYYVLVPNMKSGKRRKEVGLEIVSGNLREKDVKKVNCKHVTTAEN